ncbi:MAG: cytochrome P450 [Alphaproteobacteria bacterium]|nr:cytochrome P450 [Alphaproteobacteria bacterium]
MTDTTVTARPLSLPEELILMLLNEQNGYFHQVPGWDLHCAVVGAVLAELSLRSRIDTDLVSLILVDRTETGDPALDPILKQIADEPAQRNAQYWIERLAGQAESVIDLVLDRLVDLKILEHHDGDFWTLTTARRHENLYGASREGTVGQSIKTRVLKAIFTDEIPDPRDVIVICLVNTCDVFRFMFELDDETQERIEFICKMDLIGRSIAEAVGQSIASPMLRRSMLTKKIPVVALGRLPLNPHLRSGNIPALFADLTKEYGPVFQIRLPFAKPMTFLGGPQTNHWVHRHGRLHLRAGNYFADFEEIYGAHGVLPSLDGADHFRLRKAMGPAYSRGRLADQLDEVYRFARAYMANWKVGESLPVRMCRKMINAQLSPLSLSVESQDIIDDLMDFKERALTTHIVNALPRFMLNTPGMKRRAKAVDMLVERIQSVHTPAQRAGCPRNLADDWLSLHASDPQLVPESNLRFALSAALVASVYLGDALSFAVYAMASQPALYEKIRAEADALFENGDPDGEDFNQSSMEVTHRFLIECLRMYPIVPMSMRDVMNTFVVEGYEIPVGSRVYIAQTAAHYMDDCFPDPFSFDIDRYLPPRDEHRSPGYAPYGLGTHRCLGSRWMDLHLAVNVLIIAHYFTLEVTPASYVDALRFSPLPSMKPSKKLKFRIAEQKRELPV